MPPDLWSCTAPVGQEQILGFGTGVFYGLFFVMIFIILNYHLPDIRKAIGLRNLIGNYL
jgi:hypothetical protein